GRFVMVYDFPSDRMVPLRDADGHTMYLTGDGASPEGDRPFLDAIDMQTGRTRVTTTNLSHRLPIQRARALSPGASRPPSRRISSGVRRGVMLSPSSRSLPIRHRRLLVLRAN